MRNGLQAEAELTIAEGSKSFAAAARLFDPATRRSAVLLYAWCRYADDMVDGQTLGHGAVDLPGTPAERLSAFDAATRRALAGDPDPHPAFRALSEVSVRHGIPSEIALEHLAGFRMDVEGRTYPELDALLLYCHRVAGVVGVMMAMIMGRRDPDTLLRAADLGIAFQLTNIARDVVEDAAAGRIYLPVDWLDAAGIPAEPAAVADPTNREALAGVVADLLDAAEPFYASALVGIGRLPPRSAAAVATARSVYRAIGLKVRAAGANAWDDRLSTTRREKLQHAGAGLVTAAAARLRRPAPRDPALWSRSAPRLVTSRPNTGADHPRSGAALRP